MAQLKLWPFTRLFPDAVLRQAVKSCPLAQNLIGPHLAEKNRVNLRPREVSFAATGGHPERYELSFDAP
jgi:hypothetical protein